MDSPVPVVWIDHYIGELRLFAHDAYPKDWLPCDGRALAVADYQNLFGIIGYAYGGADAQFNLPDLKGRVVVGTGSWGPIDYALGETGGAEQVALTLAEMPEHRHSLMASTSRTTSTGPNGRLFGEARPGTLGVYTTTASLTNLHALSLGNAGSSTPHNNMQPYLTLRYCIAVEGKYVADQKRGAR